MNTRYRELWRHVPRHLGFLLPQFPIAMIGYIVLVTVFLFGVGTVIIYVGVFVILGALHIAKALGDVELTRLRWAGQPAIESPRWFAENESGPRRALAPLLSRHFWLRLLHGLIVNPVVSTVSWVVTIFMLSVGLGGVTYWLRIRFPLAELREDTDFIGPGQGPFGNALADSLFRLLIGVVALAVLPLVTQALVLAHNAIAQGMLGGRRIQDLERQVTDLNTSRGAAVAAEHASVRRLERDIHDGPQQRLIRMQMDLAAVERKLASGQTPDAQSLLAEARTQAGDALEELRALSRGLAPPILQDRGLLPALESLTARSPVPVQLQSNLDHGLRFTPEIERNVYFVVAELLTNVAKHSEAQGVVLRLGWYAPDDAATPGLLRIEVLDDGRGGARLEPGHGLHGIEDRVTGLRGTFSLNSPPSGPTAAVVEIPAVADEGTS